MATDVLVFSDIGNFWGSIGSTMVIAIGGWIVRRIRKYFSALRHAQADISTIWVHLELPRELRSGSYAYPEPQRQDSSLDED